ncbi:MAG: PIN domain-containing protein [Pyrinomonadaceae bacterium]
MIVYIESNFVLELAYLQEEHESCTNILILSEADKIELVIPAYCVGEPYDSWVRRAKQRTELHDRLSQEIRELSRSKPYVKSPKEFRDVTKTLIRSGEEEKQRLDNAVNRILETATVIPIERETIKAAIKLQHTRNLSPQDSIVYASILLHLLKTPDEPKCFITKNSKDFANPDIYKDLEAHECKLLTKFEDGLGYARSRLITAP